MIQKICLLLVLFMATVAQAAMMPSSTMSINARDVVWSANCVAAPVTTPFCREGAGATLATYCASAGAYAACVGAGGGTVDGTGATNKVAYWSDADTLTYDTLFHFDPTGNNIGLGTASFGTGLTQGIALTHDTVNWPSTNIADTVQLYARDQGGSTNSSLFVKAEAGGITSVGDRVMIGNGGILLSNGVAVGGLQLETVGPSLQMSNAVSVAHGVTSAGVATSVYLDMRPIVNTEGGIQIRGFTETSLAMILSAVVAADPVSTKSTTSDGAIKFEFGKKFASSPEAMLAGVNLVSFSDAFAGGLGTRWILDNDGDTWQTGRESSLGIDLRGSTSGTLSHTPAAVTTSYTVTWPGAQGGVSSVLTNNGSGVLSWGAAGAGGDAFVANPLSQFASTTSAQLATVLSNETGTTLAVFSDAPTFTGIPLFSGGLKTTGTPGTAIEVASGSGTNYSINSLSSAPSYFAGRVGIGSAPDTNFHIESAGDTGMRVKRTGGSNFFFTAGAGATILANETYTDLDFRTGNGTRFTINSNGDVYVEAGYTSEGPFRVKIKATQTIAAGNTVESDTCGTIKRITSAGAVSTSTTNTFTAPAAPNEGCRMLVCNVGANAITLDNNANFVSGGITGALSGTDVVLGADDCVPVISSGASGKWYQTGAGSSNG